MPRIVTGPFAWRVVVCACCLLAAQAPASTEDELTRHWIEHPSRPGPDLPPTGRSLFDALFAVERNGRIEHAVPFPFSHLRAELRNRLVSSADVRDTTLVVQIPKGRSLAREAAAPNYFHHPRTILTLAGEPRVKAPQAGEVLNYRLFIAYQPRTNALEVISYNAESGRFEFQIVTSYGAGRTPVVRYANRRLCMSCHHNAAPIFPSTPWDETNANAQIAKELLRARPDVYASIVEAVSPHAAAIDVATDRANYFAPYQLLWRTGCGELSLEKLPGAKCRGALLQAIFEFRLSGKLGFDTRAPELIEAFTVTIPKNWQMMWPNGLYVPTADLPNRVVVGIDRTNHDRLEDPLYRRLPQAVWPEFSIKIGGGLIKRLSEFLLEADVERIDRQLRYLTDANRTNSRFLRAHCTRVFEQPPAGSFRFVCQGKDGFSAEMIFRIEDGEVQRGALVNIRLPNSPILWDADLFEPQLSGQGSVRELRATLRHPDRSLSARLPSGQRLASARLTFSSTTTLSNAQRFELTLDIVDDLAPLREAVATLEKSAVMHNDAALAPAAFRRRAILSELHEELDMAELSWGDSLPAVQPQEINVLLGTQHARSAFSRNCGMCHSGDTQAPPGFLSGDGIAIERKLVQCAPRILRRLTYWQLPAEDRPRSPMPPPVIVEAAGNDEMTWHANPDYATLLAQARVLSAVNLSTTEYDELLRTKYDALPPCLR